MDNWMLIISGVLAVANMTMAIVNLIRNDYTKATFYLLIANTFVNFYILRKVCEDE